MTLVWPAKHPYLENMKSQTKRHTVWRWVAPVAAVSASVLTLGYFLDPELGRGRRLRVAGRASHIARIGVRRVGRKAAYLRRSARLRRLHAEHGFPPKEVDGRTLLDRVQSELFTDPRIPHGRINLEVEGEIVVLRGALDSDAEIEALENAVRDIPGVYGVRSFLHVAGTPAPNKVAALRASSRALTYGGWPAEPPPDVDSQTALG
jgi:hypothetical protein